MLKYAPYVNKMLADVTAYETNTMEFRLIIFNPILFIVISALSFSMNKKHNTWQTSPGGPDGAWRDNNLLRNKHFESSQKLLKSSFVNERIKKYSMVPNELMTFETTNFKNLKYY